MYKYTLTNRGGSIVATVHGKLITLAEGEVKETDDPEVARELSRWKYVELQGELPLEKETPPVPPISEDLQKLTKQELITIARPLGITIKSKMNKRTLRAAIVAARK